MPRSFKPEIRTSHTGEWSSNQLRFATREEAEAYVHDLGCRWTSVRETRVVESHDPVNYHWDREQYRAVSIHYRAH